MRRVRLSGVALLASGLLLAGCGSGDGGDGDGGGADPGADPGGTTSAPVVGDPDPVWSPTAPASPVDPATVLDTYGGVLDDLVAATDGAAGGDGGGLAWGEATTEVAPFEGVCAVVVERQGTGTAPGPDAGEPALAPVAADAGFADLAAADDPGGAVRLVATDAAGALLEWRSKETTTVAVRVATTAAECTG